jgi:hypothetical protein
MKWGFSLAAGLLALTLIGSLAFAQAPDTTKKVIEPPKAAVQAKVENPVMAEGLKVEKIACGTDVIKRELQGEDTVFAETTEKVYCWSLITGGAEGVKVNFVWYHNEKELVRVPIAVNYPRARVWAYKSMFAGWKGDWKVEVVDANNQVLGATAFKIQ